MQGQDTWDFSSPPPQPKRSAFVTVVAWIFIVIMGLTVLASVIQVVVLYTLSPPEAMYELLVQNADMERVPAVYLFMMAHLRGFTLAGLAMGLTVFVSAIGLLKRRNWARIVFISFLGFGIVWNVTSVFWMPSLYASMMTVQEMPETPGVSVEQMEQVMHVMQTVMTAFSVVMALAFAGLFAWFIKKLVSKKIKAEFGA